MTKTDYCHRVADFNEAINDTENSIASIESKLRWDDESKRDWYLARLVEEKATLEDLKRRLDAFTNEHHSKFFLS
jgi:DnaJ-domain-containing protein 1